MHNHVTLNEKTIIDEALRRMRSGEPTIPAAQVRRFLTLIGEEIQRSGELRQEFIDGLLQKLHQGNIG
jgi:hypothetical protein